MEERKYIHKGISLIKIVTFGLRPENYHEITSETK